MCHATHYLSSITHRYRIKLDWPHFCLHNKRVREEKSVYCLRRGLNWSVYVRLTRWYGATKLNAYSNHIRKNILQQLASYNGILTGRNCKWSCHKFHPFISITSIPLSTHSNSDPSQKIALSKTEISFKIFTMVFLRSAHRLFIFGYKYSDQNHYLVWFLRLSTQIMTV